MKFRPFIPKFGWNKDGKFRILITNDDGMLHLSMSHEDGRTFPTWDEMKAVRYKWLPPDKTFGILFPPAENYVNVAENCFHLWEIKDWELGKK